MRTSRLFLALAALALAAAPPLRAQGPLPDTVGLGGAPAPEAQPSPQSTPATPAATEAAAPAPDPSAALRRSAEGGPPRTFRAYAHVFAAFAIAWLLLFGYTVSIGRRFSRLEAEVRRLEGGPAS